MIRETIYEALWRKLGRRPTHTEQVNEVRRILGMGGSEREHVGIDADPHMREVKP